MIPKSYLRKLTDLHQKNRYAYLLAVKHRMSHFCKIKQSEQAIRGNNNISDYSVLDGVQ